MLELSRKERACHRALEQILPEGMIVELTSDWLHQLIRNEGYEIGSLVEREPRGLVTIRLVKYRDDSERKPLESPIVDIRECRGWTLREALFEGLEKIFREGVIDDG